MLHYRKNLLQAHSMNVGDRTIKKPCPFCDISQVKDVIKEGKYMRIIKNRVSYDIFEGIPVQDHLMLLPIAHRKTLAEFTPDEAKEYVSFIGEYESKDYSVYSRSVTSKTRSVEHVHTHLLKMTGKRVKALFFMEKPYLLLHSRQQE